MNARAQNGYTPLMFVSWLARPDLVEMLLDHGADATVIFNGYAKGMTTIMFAADEQRSPKEEPRVLETIRLLLAHGADAKAHRSDGMPDALYRAASNGFTRVVRLLLEHGADPNYRRGPGWTVLMQATQFSPTEIVRMLLDHRADVNALQLIMDVGFDTLPTAEEVARYMATPPPRDKGRSALIVAARYLIGPSSVAKARLLIAHGANVNIQENRGGGTALMYAAMNSNFPLVKLLVEAGADVNIQDDYRGTALMQAANAETNAPVASESRAASVAIARFLLAHGAKVNSADRNGMTALNCAAWNANSSLVKVLVEAGADVSARNEDGTTALMFTAGSDHQAASVATARFLIAHGARINMTARDGTTPLMNAAMHPNLPLVKLLVKAGADVNAKDKGGWTVLGRTSFPKNNPKPGEEAEQKRIVAFLKQHGAKQ